MSTGDRPLVDTQMFHENFWGRCVCDTCKGTRGKNTLGQMLQEIRSKIAETPKDFIAATTRAQARRERRRDAEEEKEELRAEETGRGKIGEKEKLVEETKVPTTQQKGEVADKIERTEKAEGAGTHEFSLVEERKEKLRKAQEKDEDTSSIIRKLHADPTSHLNFAIREGILVRKQPAGQDLT